MRITPVRYLLLFAFSAVGLAQQWEVGGAGGLSVAKDLTVTRNGQTAAAGYKPGPAFSAFAAQNLYEHLGGEFRYTFQFNDMKLSSGGTETTFRGQSHAFHYDVLLLGGQSEAALRPFGAFGGGMKLYRGTGKEVPVQPLMNFAILSKTQQVEGLLTFGGGVKYRVSPRVVLRIEVRDYFTRTPKDVIAPVPGAKIGGWIHNFVPMIGLAFGI